MNSPLLSTLLAAAVAWPNIKETTFNAIPVGSPYSSTGYDMAVNFIVSQNSKKD